MVRKVDAIARYGRVSINAATLSTRVAERRSALGLSLRDVAEKAGVSPTTVHKLERGNHRVQLDSFLKVLSVLDVLPDTVIATDGETALPLPTSIERKIARFSKAQEVPQVLERLAALLNELPDE